MKRVLYPGKIEETGIQDRERIPHFSGEIVLQFFQDGWDNSGVVSKHHHGV